MNYLFVGEEAQPKALKLKALKEETLPKEVAEFNCDTLYAGDLSLKGLQEKLKFSPARSSTRMIIIRQAQLLKDSLKEFIAAYLAHPYPSVTLVIDIDGCSPRDAFVNRIARHVKVFRFGALLHPDTFMLHRQIELKRPDFALKILRQLLGAGQRPEMVLGGLRYCWQRESLPPPVKRRRLKMLLACDLEIKTGRLKPDFALEKLVLKLCAPGKPFG